MKAEERAPVVGGLMARFFDLALKGKFKPLAGLEANLDLVFRTSTWGFREILMVIVIARLLRPEYKASKAFYDCNPRPLYEGPIRRAFQERGIPHRKSGPLNVAKAAKAINMEWAAQREPHEAAVAVVRIVSAIDSMTKASLGNFAIALHARFLEEAEAIHEYVVEARPEADPRFLVELCKNMIDVAPDGGNTAQRLIGLMIASYHDVFSTGIEVSGHLDRASVTTTTSKKAGDISEAHDGVRVVYEVTTKAFGRDRIQEAYDAARAFDDENSCVTPEIIVICRPQDAPDGMEESSIASYIGSLTYRDMAFHFADVDEWLAGQLLRMPAEARLEFYRAANDYVNEPSTALKVKKLWQRLHDE